jgi:hypothetical protein
VGCIWFANGMSSLGRWLAKNNEKFDPAKLNLLISLAVLGIILVGVILDWQNISLRNDRRAYEFAEQVLEKAEPSTTIISHWATASVFDYMLMVEDRRPDVNSFNADFYFLGIQESCQPISNQLLSSNGWIDWLTELSAEKRLCYIEPLHGLPEGYRWRNHGLCWDLTEDIEGP